MALQQIGPTVTNGGGALICCTRHSTFSSTKENDKSARLICKSTAYQNMIVQSCHLINSQTVQ